MSQPTTTLNTPSILAQLGFEGALSIADLLSSAANVRIFLDLIEERQTAYIDAMRFLRNVPPASQVVILVDFEILRCYLEHEIADREDLLEIRFFFEDCSLPYTLPKGAFQELVKHLKQQRLLPRGRQTYPEPNAVVQQLQESHQFEDLDDETTDETDDSRLLIVSRIIDVLTSSRFQPLVSEYDIVVRDEAKILLDQDFPNIRRGRKRTRNNAYDALNLAITVYPWQRGPYSRDVTYYVLLSTTKEVRAVAKHFCISVRATNGYWVSIRPRQLLLAVLLGYYDRERPRLSFARAESARDLFHSVGRTLSQYEDLLDSGVLAEQPERAAIVRDEVCAAIFQLGKEKDALRIERQRSPFLNVARSHEEQLAGDSNVTTRGRPRSFLRMLDGLLKVLDNLPGQKFFVSEPIRTPAGVIHAEVYEEDSGDDDPMIALTAMREKSSVTWRFYWDLDVSVEALIGALERERELGTIPDLFDADFADSNDVDWPVLSRSPIHRHGIIVTTSQATVGFSTRWIDRRGFQFLRLGTLASLVNKAFSGQPLRAQDGADAAPYGIAHRAEIKEIRVNAHIGDLVFDVAPPRSRLETRFTVLTSAPHVEFVCRLYERLGLKINVLPKSFFEAVTEMVRRVKTNADAG